MSIEAPEAHILAHQMNRELAGKRVFSVQIQNCTKLQQIGCVNSDLSAFNQLVGRNIKQVTSRGLVILAELEDELNLLLAPEYGGKILFHKKRADAPKNFHLQVAFNDGSAFTVTLTGLGIIQVFKDNDLQNSYVYRRDFSEGPSPLWEPDFSFEEFSTGLSEKNSNIKTSIVGKDALVVGLSNSSFQDILFRAKIHPKRKANSLSDKEKTALYIAIKTVMSERLRLGGKTQFVDFYGKQGGYTPAMGPNMKGQPCTECETAVQMVGLGGGQVYFCPKCQT